MKTILKSRHPESKKKKTLPTISYMRYHFIAFKENRVFIKIRDCKHIDSNCKENFVRLKKIIKKIIINKLMKITVLFL